MYRERYKNLLTILLIGSICILSSCRIEKRHYMRGYHIEFFSGKTNQSEPEKLVLSEVEIAPELQNASCNLASDSSEISVVMRSVQKTDHRDQHESVIEKQYTEVEKSLSPKSVSSSDELHQPSNINAQVHPAAAGSLLFGILSALCFVGMFISSFNPLALVIALTLGLFLFAILAKRLSKRAFEDMHHARNRYSGRGFAAAGLALSVITIVAFLGLLAVMLFGIAFISLS
jgi:uncharacterized membrane protein